MNPPAAAMANAIASGIVGERKRNFTSTLCQLVKMKISTTTAMTMPPIALPLRPFLAGAAGWDMLRLRDDRSPRTAVVPQVGPARRVAAATGEHAPLTVVRRFGSLTGSKGPPSSPGGANWGIAVRIASIIVHGVSATRKCGISHRSVARSGCLLRGSGGSQILGSAADLARTTAGDSAGTSTPQSAISPALGLSALAGNELLTAQSDCRW